jgi:hypothetical protein
MLENGKEDQKRLFYGEEKVEFAAEWGRYLWVLRKVS